MDMIKKYFLSSVAFSPENEQGKSQSELNKEVRDKIESEVSGGNTKNGKEKAEDDKSDNVDEDIETDDETDEDNEEENKEDEQDEEEGEKETEKEGEKEVETAKSEDDPEKLKKTIARLQRRIDKESGSKKELKEQLKVAHDKLAAAEEGSGTKILTEEDVKSQASQLAEQTLMQREFEQACHKLNKEGIAVDKTFEKKVLSMSEDIGKIPGEMVIALNELDNGGAVLNYLTDNVEEAEELYKLPPVKMAVRLNKLSVKVADAAKPKKAISKVPPPNDPITGGTKSSKVDLNSKNTSMSDWIKQRNKDVEESRKAGRYNLR